MSNLRQSKQSSDAENLYMQGYSMDEISKAMGVPIRTAYNWAYRYRWNTKILRLQEETKRLLYTKMVEQVIQSAQRYLSGALYVGQLANMGLDEIYNRVKNGQATLAECQEQILIWANILSKGSLIHKNVVPEANDKITQQMLDELKMLNERFSPRRIIDERAQTNSDVDTPKQ